VYEFVYIVAVGNDDNVGVFTDAKPRLVDHVSFSAVKNNKIRVVYDDADSDDESDYESDDEYGNCDEDKDVEVSCYDAESCLVSYLSILKSIEDATRVTS